ncbi:unnamed protein product [Darwinula stevensoni]|uniref:[histone H4]-lysine(20) N-methyltransferase n=1 Tax=Darwinula stevensoni TaxID=69355 RepID=A0A7R8WY07_9CRUS|nr:unnamed protein product [Darwinula stevensoni]CAG0878915.1 unnamed protein product [Darwinula stevensoni]
MADADMIGSFPDIGKRKSRPPRKVINPTVTTSPALLDDGPCTRETSVKEEVTTPQRYGDPESTSRLLQCISPHITQQNHQITEYFTPKKEERRSPVPMEQESRLRPNKTYFEDEGKENQHHLNGLRLPEQDSFRDPATSSSRVHYHRIQSPVEEFELESHVNLSPVSGISKLRIRLTPRGGARVVGRKPSSSRPQLMGSCGNRLLDQAEKGKTLEASKMLPLTEYFPVRRSNRKTKATLLEEQRSSIEEAIVLQAEEGLEVEEFTGKGRGVVASRAFAKGDYVVEYAGDLIDMQEAEKREAEYSRDTSKGCYIVDATQESTRVGRLINHSRLKANLVPKAYVVKGKPHLVFVAKRDISPGEEFLYDYGDRSKESLRHHPWLAY